MQGRQVFALRLHQYQFSQVDAELSCLLVFLYDYPWACSSDVDCLWGILLAIVTFFRFGEIASEYWWIVWWGFMSFMFKDCLLIRCWILDCRVYGGHLVCCFTFWIDPSILFQGFISINCIIKKERKIFFNWCSSL